MSSVIASMMTMNDNGVTKALMMPGPGKRSCECHFEQFTTTMVDHSCGLAGLMESATGFGR